MFITISFHYVYKVFIEQIAITKNCHDNSKWIRAFFIIYMTRYIQIPVQESRIGNGIFQTCVNSPKIESKPESSIRGQIFEEQYLDSLVMDNV